MCCAGSGDLEGATTAMQEATRKLAATEEQCSNLRQQLAAAQRLQQQLQLDVAYLRSRRAPRAAAVVGASSSGAATAVPSRLCCCCPETDTQDVGTGGGVGSSARGRRRQLKCVEAFSISIPPGVT